MHIIVSEQYILSENIWKGLGMKSTFHTQQTP